jgi:hypothetical protein
MGRPESLVVLGETAFSNLTACVDAHDGVWSPTAPFNKSSVSRRQTALNDRHRRVAGVDATHFDKPTDIAFTPDGSLYVGDGYGNNAWRSFLPMANSCSIGDTKVKVQANLTCRTA